MEGFWIQLLAILTLLTQTCSASDTPELIGAVGGSVTFHTHNTDTKGNAAFWNFGSITIVTVLFDDPPRLIFSRDEFKTRFTVSERGRALRISQLRMEDAGTYYVTIDGKISTFSLRVYKELPEPSVTCESLSCSDGRCLLSLRCSVPGAGFGNVSYTWRVQDWQWKQQSMEMIVNKSSQDQLEPLTCTAQNAVSSRSVTVTTSEGLCSDTPSGSWVRIGLVAGFEIAVILSVHLFFFCKSQGHWVAPHGRVGEQSG